MATLTRAIVRYGGSARIYLRYLNFRARVENNARCEGFRFAHLIRKRGRVCVIWSNMKV